ncbi:MAG: DNA polymerase IV [Lachnospiraceae bacterium]|nr:DNA polymerase IV [Lachnospiraceae bacterium]
MPEPVIFHVDVNSAFLSWEACFLLKKGYEVDIRRIPSVIGGSEAMRHGIVLAKSAPAKAFRITTGEPLAQARRKCPHLQVFPPHYEVYVENSKSLMDLLRRYAPEVEQFSIDEAYCDMTGTEKLYGDLTVFAHTLKDTIHSELGFTVNIGISKNKILAKMASDFEKPDRVHTLFPEEIPHKMWPLPVEELFYVGRSSYKKLHNLGIYTIGDLAHYDKDILISHLNKHGETIWNFANGIDVAEVTASQPENKGYGNSLTIHYDVEDGDTAKMFLLSLCETVGARLRSDHAFIKTISVSMVDSSFHHHSRQMTLPSATNITEKIFYCACQLFDQLWKGEPIRLLGVSTSKATKEQFTQYNLFDTETDEKYKKLNSAIDQIRTRYGEDSVKRARFLEDQAEHMSGGINKAKRTGITKDA